MQAVRQKPQYKSKLSSLKIFGLHNSGSISKTDGKNSQHEPFILSLSIMIKVQVIILFPLYPSSLFPFILKWEGQIFTMGPKLLWIFILVNLLIAQRIWMIVIYRDRVDPESACMHPHLRCLVCSRMSAYACENIS